VSENITHTAVVDDCVRLLLASDEICPAFKLAAREHLDMAHLGCITRSGDRCNPVLLETFRARWDSRAPEDHLEPKLAFVIGWLSHRAADRQMKPIFRRFHPQEMRTETPTECSLYHDAFIFREVYAYGKEPPYHPAMFGPLFADLAEAVDVDSLQALAQVLMRRAFIATHTFIPDVQDPETWLDNLFRLQQSFHVSLERYDDAINHPNPAKVQRYIVGDNFYDTDEPIIAAARRLQRGEAVTAAEVTGAIHAEAKSHYGIALKLGSGYIQAASDFFTSEMTVDELKVKLDIGKPGRDGMGV